jgi:WD40 repeat protein
VHALAWASSGAEVIVTGGLDATVKTWRLAKNKDGSESLAAAGEAAGAHLVGVRALDVDTTGALALSVGVDGDMVAWRLGGDGKLAKRGTATAGAMEAWTLAFSPLVAGAMVSGGAGGGVHAWRVDAPEEGMDSGGGAVAISKSASAAAFPGASGPGCIITSIAFSPDGSRFAAGGSDGSVAVLDAERLEVLAALPHAHKLAVRAVSFSHDGKELLSAGDEGRLHIFDVSATGLGGGSGGAAGGSASAASSAGGLVASLAGHLGAVLSVAAAPDRHMVATGGADRTVKLWDTRKRECAHTYEGHPDRVWGVRWDGAGRAIASVSEGGTLGVHKTAAQ